MKNIRIVFMGTPEFACSILKSLVDAKYDVVGVVSQPDKRVGRKQIIQETPVKKLALSYGIQVFQPLKIKDDYQEILDTKPDLIVTCAYGQFIPEVVLQAPTYGALNVHASLLPKLRGGAPIHKAIIYGEKETGVSIMRMVKKMDAGDYMLQEKVAITDEDTAGSLHDKLMIAGAKAITEAIPLLVDGKAIFTPQDESKATFAYNISKEEEIIDLSKPVDEVYNQIRGLIPWPVGYIMFCERKLKIHGVARTTVETNEPVGTVFRKQGDKKGLYLSCLGGCLQLTKVQLEGKKACSCAEFINGNGDRIVLCR
ncbi:methionyl-tRNA formyltransferase [Breznakia blatticola]|uniref:Methionyl-tRNA formyltransferase n=1 Tax=Breznakia blatticola TaxID=1754012 RepID=A0A4R8AAP4_9FIRM|nr:methionyl-tRNA formyltransferase [Breznakia blatticola]TDW25483.1 methionyl-tRNA formyltransferase [Breznakia blatticola]